MDQTFAQVKGIVVRLIGDEVTVTDNVTHGISLSKEILADAIEAALEAITPKIWKPSIKELGPDDGANNVYSLPSDCIDVEGVYAVDLVALIPQIELRAGLSLADAVNGNAWLLYPNNKISLISPVQSSGIRIYYSGSWPVPTSEDESLLPPSIALLPIVLYATSYLFMQRAANTSEIRQFNTSVDSGNPIQNPNADMSNFLLKRFEHEMQRIPQRLRGVTR